MVLILYYKVLKNQHRLSSNIIWKIVLVTRSKISIVFPDLKLISFERQ